MEAMLYALPRNLSPSLPFFLLPAGCRLQNYQEVVFITVLTLFLTLFFSLLHFHSLINFGIFLTVYNPCHGCHGNRRECVQC